MNEMKIIETQETMEKIYTDVRETLQYIETVEKTRKLTERERFLKKYCRQMQSLTADTMQMLDTIED